jgi:hypothetical protein
MSMHLNRRVRAIVQAMSIEELATKYLIMCDAIQNGQTQVKLYTAGDLHYELILRLGPAKATEAIETARDILKMMNFHPEKG